MGKPNSSVFPVVFITNHQIDIRTTRCYGERNDEGEFLRQSNWDRGGKIRDYKMVQQQAPTPVAQQQTAPTQQQPRPIRASVVSFGSF